ncbi:MAG: hypothetical protein QM666_11135 [Acinetobacter sp.]
MLNAFKIFESVKTRLSFPYYLPCFVGLMVFVVITIGFLLLDAPIDQSQYRKVQNLAAMGQYPQTQHMAKVLLQQPELATRQYLRLIHAYQFESNAIKKYPALDPERKTP